jgi:hypothetical protein
MVDEKEGKLVQIVDLSLEVIPKRLPQKAIYSRQQILNMFEIYTDIAMRVGVAIGLGSDVDDPSLDTPRVLKELKAKADSLPPEIRENFPKIFDELDYLCKMHGKGPFDGCHFSYPFKPKSSPKTKLTIEYINKPKK